MTKWPYPHSHYLIQNNPKGNSEFVKQVIHNTSYSTHWIKTCKEDTLTYLDSVNRSQYELFLFLITKHLVDLISSK